MAQQEQGRIAEGEARAARRPHPFAADTVGQRPVHRLQRDHDKTEDDHAGQHGDGRPESLIPPERVQISSAKPGILASGAIGAYHAGVEAGIGAVPV